jgi:hypothetical protein
MKPGFGIRESGFANANGVAPDMDESRFPNPESRI